MRHPPPSPLPTFPICIAKSDQKTSSNSYNTNQNRRDQTYTHSNYSYSVDYGEKYNDIQLSGNLQKFIQYNATKRSLKNTETKKAVQNKITEYPKNLSGTQNEVNKLQKNKQVAYQRTDVGAISNFLSQNVNDPIFSTQKEDWQKMHDKTTLNQNVV